MPNVSIGDTGKLVLDILKNEHKYRGKRIAFYSQALSEAEKMEALERGERTSETPFLVQKKLISF
jgi:hypothetical protein